jgi:hypothetical protein
VLLKLNIKKAMREIENMADADAYGDYQLGFNYGLMSAFQKFKKIF